MRSTRDFCRPTGAEIDGEGNEMVWGFVIDRCERRFCLWNGCGAVGFGFEDESGSPAISRKERILCLDKAGADVSIEFWAERRGKC